MRRSRLIALGAAALAALTATPAAAADDHDGPTGSAFALSARTTLLDSPLVEVGPRPTASYPEGADESVAEVGPGLVSARALNAASDVHRGVLTSRASIAEAVVRDILSATVVAAECEAGPDGLTGESSVADLTVLGQRIDVATTEEIDVLGVATVRINEQIRTGDTLTVNAVHVTVGGPVRGITAADIVLSQAKCTAGRTTPPTTTTTTTTTEPDDRSDTPGTAGQGGVTPAADEDVLARTGVSAALPLAIGGLLLLAGGLTAVLLARRRRD